MKKLKCFIACAFGREDVDRLYESAIKKVLNELGIVEYRVDKVNHNEKIDIKIIELIKKSDFGIADLTYARPSVYFESGLLEGQSKSVIYLAHKEHFFLKKEDVYGNFRIHFDLITKNIIQWEIINKELIDVIKKRVKLVCEPLNRKQNYQELLNKSKENFNSLSVDDRIKLINNLTLKFIKNKFKRTRYKYKGEKSILISTTQNNNIYSIHFLLSESFGKKDIEFYSPKGLGWIFHNSLFNSDCNNHFIYFISLRSVRSITIESILKSCKKIREKNYEYSEGENLIKYFFLDNINSEFELKEKFEQSINVN